MVIFAVFLLQSEYNPAKEQEVLLGVGSQHLTDTNPPKGLVVSEFLILLIIKNDVACYVKSLRNPFEGVIFVLQRGKGKVREGQRLLTNSRVESQILDLLKPRLCVYSPEPCGCRGRECYPGKTGDGVCAPSI